MLPNSREFVVAFFAVLKLGATAAPLPPDLKKAELDELLEDLRPKQVVRHVPLTSGSWTVPARASAPAVIIYTSGSTGRPKGAVFSHAAVSFANRL